MSKRIFVLLVVLMAIALLGIITVQIFWIRSSIELKEQQFYLMIQMKGYFLCVLDQNSLGMVVQVLVR